MATQTVPLNSSWLSEVTWDSDTKTADVTFNDGFVWHGAMLYDEFNDLIHAPSPGKWWHQNIMGK